MLPVWEALLVWNKQSVMSPAKNAWKFVSNLIVAMQAEWQVSKQMHVHEIRSPQGTQ